MRGVRTVLATAAALIGLALIAPAPAQAEIRCDVANRPPACGEHRASPPKAPAAPPGKAYASRSAIATSCTVLAFQLQQGPGSSQLGFGVGCGTVTSVTAVIAQYDSSGRLINYGDVANVVFPGGPWYRVAALTPLPPSTWWTCGGIWDDNTGTNLIWQCI
jgi:hypothetical protein